MKSLLVLLALSSSVLAQKADPEFKKPKEIAPGIWEVGTVKLDKNANTVTIPAKVNMVDGLVEYYLVTPEGSTHESVLVSDAGPVNVHTAMLLLGAKGAVPKEGTTSPGQLNAEALAKMPKLVGDRLQLTVKWKDKEGKEQTIPAERWVVKRAYVKNQKPTEVPMVDGPWLYNGSYFNENRFLAHMEGVYAAINTNPSALINNPRTGANDDKLWFAHKAALPPVGTPVEFTIKLENAQETQK